METTKRTPRETAMMMVRLAAVALALTILIPGMAIVATVTALNLPF